MSWSFTTAAEASVKVSYPAGLDYMEFGKRDIGGYSTQLAVVQNIGSGSLTISAISVTGSGFSLPETSCADVKLGADESCTFAIIFAPQTYATYQGMLQISSDDPQQANYAGTLKGIAAESPPDLCVTGKYTADSPYTAGTISIASDTSMEITANAFVPENAEVYLKAPKVWFNDGFRVLDGGVLHVKTGDVNCSL